MPQLLAAPTRTAAAPRDSDERIDRSPRPAVVRETMRRRMAKVAASAEPAWPTRDVERRIAPRLPTDLVPAITGVRLSPCGGTTFMVNISTSGLVVKGNTRLLLGTVVTVVFEGTFQPFSTKGRVARCNVAAIEAGVLWYDIGIAFDSPILLEEAHVESNLRPEPALSSPEPLAIPAGLFNRW
jgi:hypothetical protein